MKKKLVILSLMCLSLSTFDILSMDDMEQFEDISPSIPGTVCDATESDSLQLPPINMNTQERKTPPGVRRERELAHEALDKWGAATERRHSTGQTQRSPRPPKRSLHSLAPQEAKPLTPRSEEVLQNLTAAYEQLRRPQQPSSKPIAAPARRHSACVPRTPADYQLSTSCPTDEPVPFDLLKISHEKTRTISHARSVSGLDQPDCEIDDTEQSLRAPVSPYKLSRARATQQDDDATPTQTSPAPGFLGAAAASKGESKPEDVTLLYLFQERQKLKISCDCLLQRLDHAYCALSKKFQETSASASESPPAPRRQSLGASAKRQIFSDHENRFNNFEKELKPIRKEIIRATTLASVAIQAVDKCSSDLLRKSSVDLTDDETV